MSQATFLRHLEERRKLIEKDALHTLREKAWEKFFAMGLPSRSDAYRTVRLSDLYSEKTFLNPCPAQEISPIDAIAAAVLPACRHAHLVFVNGKYRSELSDVSALPRACTVTPLAQAMRASGSFLSAHLLKSIQDEKDPFALLNFALHAQGVFVYIAPKQNLEVPIQCIHVLTDNPGPFSAPRIELAVGAHSRIQWIGTHLNLSVQDPHCTSPFFHLFLEEAAHVECTLHLAIKPSDWCFDTVRAYLKRDAALHVVSVLEGSKATRQNVYVQCAGENSEVDIKGLWMLKGNSHAHAHATIEHTAPHTRSMQLFKGVLLDASQSSFEGKIFVRPSAQKTQAYQLNHNLIVGTAAIAHSKPNLEIFADDVKASHGATISRPDQGQLFYLKSRGIDDTEANRLLMRGFYQEILDHIPHADLRALIQGGMS
jgi:Fe-S cluster assembly protein SufD